MFYLRYARHELRRRWGRTAVTVLGLSVGIGLVTIMSALTNGLDRAQQRVLDPLSSMGTDILVTREVQLPTAPGQAVAPPSADEQAALQADNQPVVTDLSQMGKPGDHFSHDSFMPTTQLTFPADEAGSIQGLPGVARVTSGLTMLGVHQEGTVPKITAQFQTGGDQLSVTLQIPPPTPAENVLIAACADQLRSSGKPLDQQAFLQCLPPRFRQVVATMTTPVKTIVTQVATPQTDITTRSFTISGVDTANSAMAVITPAQVTSGSYFSAAGDAPEAVLSAGYAARMKLAVGGTVPLDASPFRIVGLAQPPLGGQAADVYVTLAELQTLSGRPGRVNLLLIKAARASEVDRVASEISTAFPGARVTTARDTAKRVTGSLVDAAGVAHRLGLAAVAVVLGTAFLVASLLTLSSVGRRVRELGTLRAIGWPRYLVVRQVMAESMVQGLLAGLVGVALGLAAAAALAAAAPSLEATAPPLSGPASTLAQGAAVGRQVIPLEAPVDPRVAAIAVGLALLGGLTAGATGAVRVARLQPADALRELG